MKAIAFVTALLMLATPALAQDRKAAPVAGKFDYYLLSLSWSPSWCKDEGADDRSGQCNPGKRLGFVVHGLWPQYEKGWPQDCRTSARDPSKRETRDMADLMGSPGLAWYQWKKHGRCAGMDPADYFATMRKAVGTIAIPPALRGLDRDVNLPARVIEDTLIEANPKLTRDAITVTCKGRALQEVRICLGRDLQPRACGADVARDCAGSFLMPAPR